MQNSRIWFKWLLGLLAAFFIYSGFNWLSLVEKVRHDKRLTVVSRVSPAFVNLSNTGTYGFEIDLLKAYADWLDADIALRFENEFEAIYQDIQSGIDQIAVAGLSTSDEEADLIFSNPILDINRVLVYRESGIKDLDDLMKSRILVQKGSPAEYWLDQQSNQDFTKLSFSGTSREMLHSLNNAVADAAVLDSVTFEFDSDFFPELKMTEPLTDPIPIRWAFQNTNDTSLRDSANLFLAEIRIDGSLDQLIERHFGTLDRLTYSGVHIFQNAIDKQLPKHRDNFVQAASQYELDWRLLAAIGYQESHWRHKAVSPTGVRGIMMLTRSTAKLVGVKNRLDAKQSIFGGAKYFDRLTKVIPDHINEPDRTWFALAAYNVGSGHLRDARKLTQQLGSNPDRWSEVMEYLPLLADKNYYKDLEFGKARGAEPVKYVQNIRKYYDLLRWNFPEEGESIEVPEEMLQLHEQSIAFPESL